MAADLVFALAKEITQAAVVEGVADNKREVSHHHQQSLSHFCAHPWYEVCVVHDLPACVAEPQSTLGKDAYQKWHVRKRGVSC